MLPLSFSVMKLLDVIFSMIFVVLFLKVQTRTTDNEYMHIYVCVYICSGCINLLEEIDSHLELG